MTRLSQGFTLIELIATMVIASILASSLITGYRTYNEFLKANKEILNMVNTIRQARDYCMEANEIFFLSVNTDADTYTLEYKTDDNALNLPGQNDNVFTMPNFVDFTASTVGTDLEFNILGEPSATKTITINSGERIIEIVYPTGNIYAH
jgi:prepilin-type N-terminal cleavage/methylation domain-containing protein